MGNRSNINFITEHRDSGEVVGLNLYCHWGGTGAQIDALNAAGGPAYGRRHDAGFFVRCVARAVTKGLDSGDAGAGLTPFVAKDEAAAYAHISDNQHVVLAFDLVRQLVVIAEPAWESEPTIIAQFPLDQDGLEQARQALVPDCDPAIHCERCAARAAFQATGMTRVEAEAAAEREAFEPGRRWIEAMAGVAA